MRMIWLPLIVLSLVSCGPSEYEKHFNTMKPLNNEEIANAIIFCESKHLHYSQRENQFQEIVKIDCWGSGD